VKVKIPSSSKDDLVEGYRFSEDRSQGVGRYLLDSISSDIDSLIITARIDPKVFGGYHRVPSSCLPFAAYCRTSGNIASVDAVSDCRKSPARI
jgi:hypothetical protein